MSDQARTYDVFISYARLDGAVRAIQLERDLRAEGFTTWRDTRNLDPDQDFTVELEHAIEHSARVAVCLTPATRREDTFVHREISYALAVGKPVIPLIFEDTLPPISIITVTREDFTNTPWDTAVIRLCRRLRLDDIQSGSGPTPPHDPYREYLNALYQEIVHYLKQTVFSMNQTDDSLITLQTEPVPGATTAAPSTATRVLPMAFFDMAGLGMDEDDDQPDVAYQSFRDAFERYGHRVLLLGEPGAGKTTTLMAFARNAVSRRLQDPNLPLPIVVPVVTWDARHQPPLITWLAEQFPTLKRSDLQNLLDSGNTLLLLDGLDELGGVREDQNTVKRYDPRVRFIQQLPENNQIVVSCRAHDYAAMAQKISLAGAVSLQPLNNQQMRAYLRDVPDLWDLLSADVDLLEAARTPLLLSLFAFTYRDQRDAVQKLRALHSNPDALRDKLFETYLEQRYAREKRRLEKMNQPLPFTLPELAELLGQLAMRNFAGNRGVTENVLHRRDLAEVMPVDRIPSCTRLALLLGILVPETSGSTYRFIHRLMRDYLAYMYALKHLQNDDAAIRLIASETFRRRVDTRAFDPLVTALRDTNPHVRRNAAAALGQIGDPRAVKPLAEVVQHDTWNIVRISAIEALGTLATSSGLSDPEAAPDPVSPAAEARSEITAQVVKAMIEDSDWRVRRTGARILGDIGDRRATRYLVMALRDTDSDVRYETAKSLGKLGDTRAIQPLIAALKDRDPRVRRYAILSLGDMQAAGAVGPLSHLLGDTHRGVIERICDAAARALEYIGTPEALAAVRRWRNQHNNPPGDQPPTAG